MQGTLEEWRRVFFISGAIELAAALVYILLAQDGIVDWALEPQELKQEQSEKQKTETQSIYTIKSTDDNIIKVQL